MDWTGRKVLVVGMARSGIAAARLLVSLGAEVWANDDKRRDELGSSVAELPREVRDAFGKKAENCLAGMDAVVVSPGVPSDAPVFRLAQEKGITIIGEMELACQQACSPIIAITGTNGKTTTTAFVGTMMQKTGIQTYVAGNIGDPVSLCVREAKPEDWLVLEVSSFQLETAPTLRPRVSAILNLKPDHLNRHKTMENYVATKANIFRNQREDDVVVLNYDQPLVRSLAEKIGCKVLFFSRKERVPAGACIVDDRIVLINPDDGNVTPVARPGEVRIPGDHNLENVLAACAIGMAAGVQPSVMRHTMASFEGIEHRIETVGTIGGVRFINDSKGTNPDSTICAVQAMNMPTILVAGGYNKGTDFAPLLESFTDKIQGMVVLGETAGKLMACAREHGFSPVTEVKTLKTAVRAAYDMCRPGYTVLFSPACASYDMFKDFEERGRVFKQVVAELQEELDA